MTTTARSAAALTAPIVLFDTSLRREHQLEGIRSTRPASVSTERKLTLDAAELGCLNGEETLGRASFHPVLEKRWRNAFAANSCCSPNIRAGRGQSTPAARSSQTTVTPVTGSIARRGVAEAMRTNT